MRRFLVSRVVATLVGLALVREPGVVESDPVCPPTGRVRVSPVVGVVVRLGRVPPTDAAREAKP